MIQSENTTCPKVSIIIPVYNVKQYLKEALDSVINQTYENLEIIVVDDGSNDGSEIICEEYAQKDNRIKLIHQENKGLSAARNTGLDNLTGEYVAFLDSDDAFLPDAIEKLIKLAISNKVDCVNFQSITCKTTKNMPSKKFSYNNPPKMSIKQGIYSGAEAMNLVAKNIITVTAWNKFSKREIWDNLRFPEGHVYEDLYIIFSMISKIKNLYLTNEPLILYRIRPKSINFDNSIKNINDLIDSWSVFENFIEKNTPKLFDKTQASEAYKKILVYFLLKYAKTLSKYFPHKTEVMNLLKEKIIQLSKITEIANCGTEIRLLNYMIFNHPILLSIFFRPCYKISKITKSAIRNIRK